MPDGPPARKPLSYEATRRLLLAAGLLVLGVVVLVTWARRVEPAEVLAVVMFVPIFIAFVFGGLTGGLVSAAIASVVYVLARRSAIDAVGFATFASLILSRTAAFFTFGAVGGWAVSTLRHSIVKLDLYDDVDDATGLGNARFLVEELDLEAARAQRYESVFSVAVVTVPGAALASLSRRHRRSVLGETGALIRANVRAVDRPVHGVDGDDHLFAVVLPETAADGARVFTDRFAQALFDVLAERGVHLAVADLAARFVTVPGNEDGLAALREAFAAIDAREHPEAPPTTAQPLRARAEGSPPAAPGPGTGTGTGTDAT